ncbi:MAG TPA: thiosulfate oxidation carrier protein SoxY [Burkholderiaceae bacterium]|nr:thiosulfate oxidation carrier protein SoxY [Burkholderiaceae bacterium]
MNTRRRTALKHSAAVAGLLLGAGLWPAARAQGAAFNRAAFDAKTMADVAKALGGSAPAESKDITLQAPDIAENGAVVPLGAATTLPGARRILLLVEKNPNALAGAFDLSDSVEPNLTTRVKMGQTSNVYAVVMTADNKVLFAQKEVKVTLGGCGG